MANHHVKTAPAAKLALIIGLALLALTVFILLNSLNNTIEKNTVKGDIDVQAMAENKAAITGVNLKPVGEVRESDGSGAAPSATRSGEDVYKAVCSACHATGAAGAPKVDDKAAWEPRVANGFDALLKTAINGKGAMPARGGQNVPDDELTNAIAYMTKQAGFSLDIPKAAAPADKVTATTTEATATPEAKPAETTPTEATATPEAKPAETTPTEATATPEAKPAETTPTEATATPEAKPTEAAPTEATATPEAKPAETTPTEATATPAETTPTEATATPAETTPTEATATPEAKLAEPVAPASEAKPATPAAEKKAATTSAIDGKAIYKTVCFVCHDVGVANAPKLTDKAAWQPRIATGKDALYHSALNGKGAMPPKGGQMKLSDDEVKAVVDYMLSVVQ